MDTVDERLEALEQAVDTLQRDNDQLRRVLVAAGRLLADRDLSLAESSTAPS